MFHFWLTFYRATWNSTRWPTRTPPCLCPPPTRTRTHSSTTARTRRRRTGTRTGPTSRGRTTTRGPRSASRGLRPEMTAMSLHFQREFTVRTFDRYLLKNNEHISYKVWFDNFDIILYLWGCFYEKVAVFHNSIERIRNLRHLKFKNINVVNGENELRLIFLILTYNFYFLIQPSF